MTKKDRCEQLEAVMGALADELAGELDDRYPPDIRARYPSQQERFERDMSTIYEAWALLKDPARG